ncbi:class I SAM-dependent methyltransferase [Leifsonia sp. ZF2019]|uniref:class I SAM-dependent methyltransferase n=1 Tax=Leifsonia sp. ZF2019 TaxID=2781978 RepID=UPI001CBC178A|nr:class I SAM-dependent methyltransferase [Leifsonia sp. ZF2019]UAJ80698.1 class I SAM-dependent methyltransferase [Leifsonia sp. ZF2019]
MTFTSTTTTAIDYLKRWDAQQTAYIRHRDLRFAAMARIVSDLSRDTTRPRILDLASGPGSLGRALLDEIPHARVVMADKDPALLAIAANAHAGDDRVEILETDLDDPGWTAAPVLAEPFDAIVSTTALHWLRPETLVRVYFELAGMLRPQGVFLNGDHLAFDAVSAPTLHALSSRDDELQQKAAFSSGTETWDQWWAALGADPDYAEAMRAREIAWGGPLDTPPPKVTLGFHIEALRCAGFTEAGTAWQYLDDYIVSGIR